MKNVLDLGSCAVVMLSLFACATPPAAKPPVELPKAPPIATTESRPSVPASTQPRQTASTPAPASTRPDQTSSAASQPAADDQPRIVKPFEGITVVLNDAAAPGSSRVEIAGMVCIEAGWLEQIACAPATREHESLIVVKAKPSQVHAALLLAGFSPGAPGRWTYENEKFGAIDPTGEELDIAVRYVDAQGQQQEHSISKWIRDPDENRPFPDVPWRFAGSQIAKNPPFMGEGEHYVADMTGSIIGLVTFGDEVIGFGKVLADEVSVQAPEWEANTEALPPLGTEVTILVQKR